MDPIVEDPPSFTKELCGKDPWGPWEHGVLTLCFEETVIFGLHSLYLLILGTYRAITLWKRPYVPLPYTFLYLTKFLIGCSLAFLPLGKMSAHLWLDTAQPYELFSDAIICTCWIFSTILLVWEYDRGLAECWILRSWWLLAFIVAAAKLQTIVVFMEQGNFQWDYYVFIVRYCLYALISVLGLWFNEVPLPDLADPLVDKEKSTGSFKSYSTFNINLVSKFKDGNKVCPEVNANILSRYTFWWFNPLVNYGYENALVDEDLYSLAPSDSGTLASEKFERAWANQLKKPNPSLPWALFAAYGGAFMWAGFYKIVNDILTFAGPIILYLVIDFVQYPDEPFYYGLIYVAAMLVTNLILSVAIHQYFHIGFRIGMHIRAAIVTTVYRKAFRLSSGSRQNSTLGEIVNLMSLDAQRLMDLIPYLHMTWSAFVQIAVSLVLLWQIVGVATLAGLAVMVALIPVNAWLAKILGNIQKEMMKQKDSRNKAVNEALQGIRVIKFFAWENNFLEKITGIRGQELKTLIKSAYLKAITLFFWSSTPLFVSVATFAMFGLLGNTLDPSTAFTALALFNVLRFPLNMLPMVMTSCVEAWVSSGRLQGYLLSPELDPDAVEHNPQDNNSATAISISNGQFSWDVLGKATVLHNLNFKVGRGELLAVVGSVGSGKSALLNALLGDLYKLQGIVTINGGVALVTQQAWIQNATLRENILYGLPYDDARYERTIQVCELTQDLAMLPAGDNTEIGEKGINLSGGQKQRVSMARAVYSNRDIYLLDDPLSAVDAHVGRAIFENCIVGELGKKTRLLVTHQLQYMPMVDRIMVLKDGNIVEMGTFEELMNANGSFSVLFRTHVHDHQEKAKEDEEDESEGEEKEKKKKGKDKKKGRKGKGKGKAKEKEIDADAPKEEKKKETKIMSVEERDVGSVSWRVYRDYAVAIGGIFISGLILLFYVGDQTIQVSTNWWLSEWSTSESKSEDDTLWYLGIYSALGLSATIFVLLRAFVFAYGTLQSAKKLHERLISRIFRAPMSFFDTTPVGRILNRFSKDIYTIDEMLPRSFGMFLVTLFNAIGIVVVISMVTPFFLCALIPLCYFYHSMQQLYIRSSREIKRLDGVSKSPIYAHFTETLAGVSVIRSFGKTDHFIAENERKLDLNQRAYFASCVSNRWLGIRVEFIGTWVVTLATLFAVLERDNIDPGLAGLSITYALNVTGTLNWLVRMATELETQLVSVERVLQYVDLQVEAPPIILATMPPHDWPQQGAIEIEDLKLRYRPGLDLVLKGISCKIKPREKVGVVGRTGAGKSSLMLALFRLVEPAEGRVKIDGIDISRIGLDTLRSRLSIIPQDPTLFTGTIRSNLDPFSQYAQEELVYVLKKVHLYDYVKSQPGQLDSPVTEYGENLSVGQRQLMCLGRALLRRAKILVMDEATAAVDFETDALIQKTIAEEFEGITVLTIAHRIHTIINYDRVMVLDKGCIAEFDSPQALLSNPNSIFYSMVHTSGTTSVSENDEDTSSSGSGSSSEEEN